MSEDGCGFLDGLSEEDLAVAFENASAAVDHHLGIMLACMHRMGDVCTPDQLEECKKVKQEISDRIK